MKKEELVAMGLTEEQAQKVLDGFGTMVPKSRLDDKINEVKDLTTQLKDRDTQLTELKKVDAAGLQNKITELQQKNETDKADFEEKIKDTQLKSALKLALTGKVHDADLVTGLIDRKLIELSDEGKVTKGLDEQLKTLQESKSFLFVPEKQEKQTTFKGWNPAGGDGGNADISIGANFAKSANEKGTSGSENSPWG